MQTRKGPFVTQDIYLHGASLTSKTHGDGSLGNPEIRQRRLIPSITLRLVRPSGNYLVTLADQSRSDALLGFTRVLLRRAKMRNPISRRVHLTPSLATKETPFSLSLSLSLSPPLGSVNPAGRKSHYSAGGEQSLPASREGRVRGYKIHAGSIAGGEGKIGSAFTARRNILSECIADAGARRKR